MVNEIIEGWSNVFKKSLRLLDTNTIELSKVRYELCYNCPYNDNDSKCSKCGCFLKAKLMSRKSRCPIGKW